MCPQLLRTQGIRMQRPALSSDALLKSVSQHYGTLVVSSPNR
ncbi:hypothetical protein [Kitasatospora terrestris]